MNNILGVAFGEILADSIIPYMSNPLDELDDKIKEIDEKAEKRMRVADRYYNRSKWKGAARCRR